MLSDSQARAILQKFESDPKILLGMQAIAKALTRYGLPPGWVTPSNNWYAVAGPTAADGSCGPLAGRPTYPVQPGVCALVYESPEQAIAHTLELWFPVNTPELAKQVVAFRDALLAGNTDAIAQMVMQRAWGIENRSLPATDLAATPLFAADFYAAANEIAAALGQTSHFSFPSLSLLPLTPVPLPVQVVPIPVNLPGVPGGNQPPPVTPGGGNQPPPVTPGGGTPPAPPPPKSEGVSFWKVLIGVGLLVGAGAAIGAKVLK